MCIQNLKTLAVFRNRENMILRKHDTGIKYTMISNNQEVELEKAEKEKDLGYSQ